MIAEKNAGRKADSTAPSHWLDGRFFFRVPDISDETSWVISKGRAWPAFMAVMRLLKHQERKGKTAEVRADASEGRLVVGVNALARSAGVTSTTMLRQLRFLERQGFIKTHQELFVRETDPETGKITRNASKAPPKVIVMTWEDRFMRPAKAIRRAKADTAEPNANPSGDTAEPNAKASSNSVRNDCVSIDENLHRGFHPMDENRRPTADASREASTVASKTKKPADPRPPLQAWEIERMKAQRDIMAERYADILGMTKQGVIDLWRQDHKQLRKQLIAAGHDPDTGRRFGAKPTGEAYQEKAVREKESTTFDIRRTTTAAVALKASDLRPAEDPLERLQEAVEALPDASRDRADELGHQLDDQATADTQLVMRAVEKKRAAGAA